MEENLERLIQSFLDTIVMTNAEGTVENYRRHLNNFAASVKGKKVSALRPADLVRWGQKWHQVQAVQRLFNWAAGEAELVPRNPFRKVKKPPLGQRRRTISRKVFLLIARNTDRCFRDYLITMRETIARPQEIRSLCWEQLTSGNCTDEPLHSLENGKAYFCLDEYKARRRRADPNRPRIIPISKRLSRLLLRLARARVELAGPIFLNSERMPWSSNAVRLRMRNLRNRLGLGIDHRGERIVAYTIRHTQATVATAHGVRDKTLAELMGHSSTRTTSRYQHLQVNHLQDAIDRLDFRKRKSGHSESDKGE